MELITGIAIILIVFFSSNMIEKRLRSIENQNNRVIEEVTFPFLVPRVVLSYSSLLSYITNRMFF